ncbi:MAG: hypothetical protein IKZ13_05215 [Akkermansia sp.]|nr:hypothetical protein [Akkermansia sp.]
MTTELFYETFHNCLTSLLGKKWEVLRRVYNPQRGDKVDLRGIGKNTALVLWGDEYSQVFPSDYYKAAGVIIKPYCPESWIARGIIPMTDGAMIYMGESEEPSSCSTRLGNVFYSGNLNYRRTDVFRAVSGKSFGYPFRVSSNYPITGQYPFVHKVEAVMMHTLITKLCSKRDFSNLYPESYIVFNRGFMKGALSVEEYHRRLLNSKVAWCPAGFMTNETSRLIEAASAGCAVICGTLPKTEIYKGHPFLEISDWRSVCRVTDMLLADSARMDDMGQKARLWYQTHFSPVAQAERIARAIQNR